MERIIFDNHNYDVEAMRAEYKEFLIANEFDNIDERVQDDNELYEFISDTFDTWFDDEQSNLDIETDEQIIAIADIGLWNGRRKGYKLLGYNVNTIFNCFSQCDYVKLYAENRAVKGLGIHHDGTNYVEYRKFKAGYTEEQQDRVLNAIYDNADNVDSIIKRYTVSIYPLIKKVYGW